MAGADRDALRREVRLALVMNGGVSLAIWIGGVTHEIDALRRSYDEPADGEGRTTALYRSLCSVLRQRVVVDVVSGASAGGINGALLVAAIHNGVRLPGLRETWISLGDFRRLLRATSEVEPSSILRGDDYVLVELRSRFDEIFSRAAPATSRRTFLYITGTDIYGRPTTFADSTGRQFDERDHRVTFRFVSQPRNAPEPRPPTVVTMPKEVDLHDPRAAELLSRASRSTSSFPGAFEAHELRFERADEPGESTPRWLIDGGVLDNQPFNPVLNQIALMPADVPVRRVVAYVIPYVTEPQRAGTASPAASGEPAKPTLLDTVGAAGELPRGLPKLESLERVQREQRAAREAHEGRLSLLAMPGLVDAARELVPAYRSVRHRAVLANILAWRRASFVVGRGPGGRDEVLDPAPLGVQRRLPQVDPDGMEALPWLPPQALPADGLWEPGTPWRWGLSPAERIAAEALAVLHGQAQGQLAEGSEAPQQVVDARALASRLVWRLREAQSEFAEDMQGHARGSRGAPDESQDAADAAFLEEARVVYERVWGEELGSRMTELDATLEQVRAAGVNAPTVGQLLASEVVRHAAGIEMPASQSRFVFLYMSAGLRNALGHPADSPETKLAGMKLNHFAGFLKRSWRANDWLWGRLDGTEHLLRAILDLDYLAGLRKDDQGLDARLAALAFDVESNGAPDAPAMAALSRAWEKTLLAEGVALAGAGPREQFAAALERACALQAERDSTAVRYLDVCRSALAARLQLEVLAEDLERVAVAAEEDLEDGGARTAIGADWARSWNTRVAREEEAPSLAFLQAQFESLRIGQENPRTELTSRLAIRLLAQGAAVASSALAGSGGGAPLFVRGLLGVLRGITRFGASVVRLVVDTPALGLAVLVALTALVVWGLTDASALAGALLPLAAIGALVLLVTLLTVGTSDLEGRVRKKDALRVAVFLAAPLAAAAWLLLGFLPGHDWLAETFGGVATVVAGLAAGGAALMLIVRLALGHSVPVLRRPAMRAYRWLAIVAGAALAVGGVYEGVAGAECEGTTGWACVADERSGALLVLLLLGVAFVATLGAELLGDLKAARRDVARRRRAL